MTFVKFPVTFEYCWLMQLNIFYYNHNVFSLIPTGQFSCLTLKEVR